MAMLSHATYSYINTLGVDIILCITSGIMLLGALLLIGKDFLHTRTIMLKSDQSWRVLVSSSFNLFLLLMSYTFSQVKEQENSSARVQLILTWMVLAEIIRQQMNTTSTGVSLRATTSAEKLFAMLEQLGRICWVGYLVYHYAPIEGFRINLFVLCISSFAYEIVKYAAFMKAKDSYLMGKHVELIDTHVKRVVLQDDLQTAPLNCCDYIVVGEETKEIKLSHNGYQVCQIKSGTEGFLTIGRVFELRSTEGDDTFASAHPCWHDTCLSVALAKMLMRRFAMLPLDEAGSTKALNFVLMWLNGYIDGDLSQEICPQGGQREKNLPQEENNNPILRFAFYIRHLVFKCRSIALCGCLFPKKEKQEKNQRSERVFHILNEELKIVSRFFHSKLLMYQILKWVYVVDIAFGLILSGALISFLCHIGLGTSLNFVTMVKSFHGNSQLVHLVLYCIDCCIILALFSACLYLQEAEYSAWFHWRKVRHISTYVKNPSQWDGPKFDWSSIVWYFTVVSGGGVMLAYKLLKLLKPNARDQHSVLHIKTRSIFCIKVSKCIIDGLPKVIRRLIRKLDPIRISTSDVKEAVLRSFINSRGILTNGESSLRIHSIVHLKWACQPNGSTTEAILVWNIATTLFIHKNPRPQQGDDTSKEREVASRLSSYCHYLVASLPELLPDDVEWTEKMYEDLKEEISGVIHSSGHQLPISNSCDPCDRVLLKPWDKDSVVGKGVRLATELMEHPGDKANVWRMLADFWVEMMLFIAPSHNIEVHEQVLETDEFITQIWALLTHAGILTRPKTSESADNNV